MTTQNLHQNVLIFIRSNIFSFTKIIIILLSRLPTLAKKNSDAFWLLIGIMCLHRENCKRDGCMCENIEILMKDVSYSSAQNSAKASIANSKILPSKLQYANSVNIKSIQSQQGGFGNSIDSKNSSTEQHWQNFIGVSIGVILDDLVIEFKQSINIRLMVSYHQEIMEKNFYKAFFQLVKAEKMKCSLEQQIAIHHMKMILDKEIFIEENAKTDREFELDLNLFLTFEEKRRLLDSSIRKSTHKVIQFWGMLLSSNMKVNKIYLLGGHISTGLQNAYNIFNEIITIFPDHIKTYLTYSSFLREVANNEIEAEECQEKAITIKRNLDFGRRQGFTDDGVFSINRETAIVIISGDLSSMGIIINVNEYAFDIFGYSYNDLVGFTVNRLIPKVVSVAHDKFLIKFFETGQRHIINRECMEFGQCKNGLLVPISQLVKTMPGLTNGLRYVSFIRRDLSYIRKKYLKLPYQYNLTQKINFIITTAEKMFIEIAVLFGAIFCFRCSPKITKCEIYFSKQFASYFNQFYKLVTREGMAQNNTVFLIDIIINEWSSNNRWE